MNFTYATLLFGGVAQALAQEFLPSTEIFAQRDVPTWSAPGQVNTITQDRFREAAAPSLGDLFSSELGLPVTGFFGNPGTGFPILRGFAENASSRALILVDGLPVSRPDLSAPAWFEFPLGGLERIDVAKGSRTVRYGSGALAGVIALQTRRPSHQVTFHGETSLGSQNTEIHRLSLASPVGPWAFSLQHENQRSDGFRENAAHATEAWQFSFESPKDASWHARWVLSQNDWMSQNPGSLSKTEFLENPRQSLYQRYGVADQFFSTTNNQRISQHLEAHLTPQLDWQTNASWMGRQRQINFGAGSHSDHDISSWFLESLLRWHPRHWQVELGLRRWNDALQLDRFREIQRENRFANADLERVTQSAFVTAAWEFVPHWTANVGASSESYRLQATTKDQDFPNDPSLNFSDEKRESAQAFEAGLAFQWRPNTRFWARYDRVYRLPVMDEVVAYQGFALSNSVNQDLYAERGHGFELGWEHESHSWKFSGNYYQQLLNGEILYDYLNNLNSNFANTQRWGCEHSLQWEKNAHRFQLTHHWTQAEFRSGEFRGNQLPLVPHQSLSAQAYWQANDALQLGIEATYVADSPEGNDFANEESPLPSRVVWNSSLRYALNPHCTAFFRIHNLFDLSYASLKYQSQWYPAAGRQFLFGLQFQF